MSNRLELKSNVRHDAMSDLPFISIIVPYGPGMSYQTVLESIRKVDYPRDLMEFIVAEGKQPARQRNKAVEMAKGKFVFFFDDDVIVEKDTIRRMLSFYGEDEVAMVGGPNLTPSTDTFLQKCFGYVLSSYFATAKMSNRYKSGGEPRGATEKDLILCNLSSRTSILRKFPFDEDQWPAEEVELFNWVVEEGHKLIYDPDAIVYHSRRPTLYRFAKQNFGYGRGRMELFLKRPGDFEFVFLIPAIFTLYAMAFPFLSLSRAMSGLAISLLSVPMFAYVVITLLVSMHISLREKSLPTFLVIPFLFPFAHLPYGLGTIYGFFKKFFGKRLINKDVKTQHVEI